VKDALDFACLAAALTCSRAGADPPWKSEMIARESR
jgi:sugar/nucleoside kinase (ribokinase family)